MQRCDECERFVFPPYPECLECGCRETSWVSMHGTGTVHSVANVVDSILPGLEELLPLRCALVELDEGRGAILPTNVFAHAGQAVAVGTRVRVDFESVKESRLPIFRPFEADTHSDMQANR